MGRLGLVVGGHWESRALSLGEPRADEDATREGLGGTAATVYDYEEFAVLARHVGREAADGARYVLPHEVDHSQNMAALVGAGCDRVLAIGSVGGLRTQLTPGTYVCPDDFIALDAAPATALEGLAAHRVPGFDRDWRHQVLASFAATGAEMGVPLVDRGVYWQVNGPRLETPAEIRFVARHADVIGMTIASECIAAGELGLRYAAVCIVDNFANGIAETELTLADVEVGRKQNRRTLARALRPVLETIG